jgi:hypothetical protein
MPGPGIPVLSVGDMNMAMGVCMTGVPNVLVGMRPIATMTTSLMAPHPWMGIPPKPIHTPNPIMLNCTKSVLAGPAKMPVAHIASIDACFHTMIGPGTPTVLVSMV